MDDPVSPCVLVGAGAFAWPKFARAKWTAKSAPDANVGLPEVGGASGQSGLGPAADLGVHLYRDQVASSSVAMAATSRWTPIMRSARPDASRLITLPRLCTHRYW